MREKPKSFAPPRREEMTHHVNGVLVRVRYPANGGSRPKELIIAPKQKMNGDQAAFLEEHRGNIVMMFDGTLITCEKVEDFARKLLPRDKIPARFL